jgi:hypothetical protein
MSNIKQEFGAESTFTITLASLASSATAARESTAINNSSDKFSDALVKLRIEVGAGTISNDRAVHVFAYGSVDGGTTYTDLATGTDAGITLRDPSNLRLIGSIFVPTQSLAYVGGPWSVASAFGGRLPEHWGIVVRNFTGIALHSTEGNHKKLWQGIYHTVN